MREEESKGGQFLSLSVQLILEREGDWSSSRFFSYIVLDHLALQIRWILQSI